ncbi:hypothetical protein BFW01_g2470 [Lasiodiplodia theobromae]|uniref:uncharacterized protein n=1 Tax=Lasiodiplodia theobromae TaxID=45133 RepID=UPI0015C2C9AE|nr:uncharacterized protein LTHEOB_5367 [Lasiodiplodia theobromae]KAF4544956.1 hypothetical protein LTHEOB_5367 [Lasiodiplodia theobromae]KAF9631608.1 hypothetical protein BFW01_g2470 [Lasiodiplodia theobromae]
MAAASSSTTPVIGRDRSVSDVAAAHNVVDDPRPPEAVHLPRSASYTYFPPVKDLEYEDSSVVELKGRISEAELHSSRDEDSPYSSSGGSTPENEPADPPEGKPSQPVDPLPQRSRLSRFFSSSREPVTSGGPAKDGLKDKSTRKDPSRQLQKQPPKEVRNESHKTPQQESSKQISKQAQKPAPNHILKETSRDTPADTAKDAAKPTPQDASRESPKESQQKEQSENDKEEEEKEKTDRAEADQQAVPPKRSLTHLRRKSWVPSSAKESSPSKSSGEDGVNGNRPSPEKRRSLINTSRRKSILRKDSDPPPVEEERAERPAAATRRKSFIRKESEGSPASEDRLTSRVSRRMSILRNNSDRKETESLPAEDPAGKSPKKSTVLTKRPRKPSDAYIKPVKAEELPPIPAVPEIPKSPNLPKSPSMPASPVLGQSFSTDRLPTLMRSPPSQESVIPPLPRTVNQEKLKTFSLETPKKKDELWGQFRSLDGDYQKFSSKSIALKANVVRQNLIPFLRTYAAHPSNSKLRPEDLDRRSNILNRWWTGLLEMINGKNNQSISGSDRPHILQAIVGIMERPEWRTHPSPFAPLTGRHTSSLPRSHSSTSVASIESDFLAESVHHNVRNTFIQNLTAQMGFVVEKMSLRNAPASLVNFCGKTCAYAFFFCPGMADILVRLWSPSLDAMRRVMAECKMSDRSKLDETSKVILPNFPPSLHSLGFTNLHKTFRELRKPAPFPLGTANLPWHGSWVKRWSGTESDLFYVFTKCYHILITDFLPEGTSAAERLCAPGLVMVHAQILANLDETLHRHAAMTAAKEEDTHSTSSVTFDDVLADGPDAAASALPIPPANAVRLMAENRLIMLLRDFLSAGSSHVLTAPHIFADSFSSLLQAAARRVSIFDHNASYTLCDFLEEALLILLRYERAADRLVVDWTFWISVYKRMTESHNTTTEIRLLSFLYSVWGTIVEDEKRKSELCLNFLLEPGFFESRFNHWCPMLRAYYMRLLCWRISRFDGEATDCDSRILKSVEERLQSVWAHYLYLQEVAQTRNEPLPSTTPCNPAPGRRLLIIRHDAPLSPANGPFLSFDGIVSNAPKNQQTAYGSHSSLENQLGDTNIRPTSALSIASDNSDAGEEDNGKKRFSLLRNLLSVSKPRSKSRSPEPPTSREGATNASNSTNITPDAAAKKHNTPDVPPHRSYCFRFSLEWVHDKRFANPGPMRLLPPRLPPAAHNFLHAQREESETANPKPITSVKPEGPAITSSKYAGRALGEWAIVVGECQSFFQRRKDEGVPNNKLVETPTLGVEVFRRPG